MRSLMMMWLLCAALVARAADDKKPEEQPSDSELCSVRTVAVVGDDDAAKETRKRVEKKTWMKRVGSPEQADGILEAQMMLTSFSLSMSENRVTSASREGYVTMQLKRRQPEKVLWEGKQALDTGNLIDDLLTSLQKKAGCGKR